MSASAPVVIVGAGLAGFGVARELRKLDREVPIRMVTTDSGAFYSKPNLSNALAWKKLPPQLVAAPREAIAAQLGVEILDRVRATAILRSLNVEVQQISGPIVNLLGRFEAMSFPWTGVQFVGNPVALSLSQTLKA